MTLPFELFVGLRYLQAKRRTRTISFNTFISIAGITLGVAALIGTLGIMTGFKEDIQAKILGTTSHIVVQPRGNSPLAAYSPLVTQIEKSTRSVRSHTFYFQILRWRRFPSQLALFPGRCHAI